MVVDVTNRDEFSRDSDPLGQMNVEGCTPSQSHEQAITLPRSCDVLSLTSNSSVEPDYSPIPPRLEKRRVNSPSGNPPRPEKKLGRRPAFYRDRRRDSQMFEAIEAGDLSLEAAGVESQAVSKQSSLDTHDNKPAKQSSDAFKGHQTSPTASNGGSGNSSKSLPTCKSIGDARVPDIDDSSHDSAHHYECISEGGNVHDYERLSESIVFSALGRQDSYCHNSGLGDGGMRSGSAPPPPPRPPHRASRGVLPLPPHLPPPLAGGAPRANTPAPYLHSNNVRNTDSSHASACLSLQF